MPTVYFAMDFIGPDLAANLTDSDFSPMWTADQDAALSERIAARNSALAQCLADQIPGLSSEKEMLEPDEYDDERLSQEAVLRRYHRARMLAGTWHGRPLSIRIFDGSLEVSFAIVDLPREKLPEFRAELKQLLAGIAKASGMQAWFPGEGMTLDIDTAIDRLMANQAKTLEKHFRAVARDNWKRKLAIPGVIFAGLIALAMTVLLVNVSIQRGKLIAGVDINVTETFITEQTLPLRYQFGVFPQFELQGHIVDGTKTLTLSVFRDEFLEAGPGALYSVLPTNDAATPYLLRRDYENSLPLIRAGSVALPWHVILALLPLAIWYSVFVHPLVRTNPDLRASLLPAIGGRLVNALWLILLLAVILFMKRAV